MTTWMWGTVTQTAPLLVKLDGDSAALIATPDTLIDPSWLAVGDRVRCELTQRRLVVHGRAGGFNPAVPALPASVIAQRASDSNSITSSTTWGQTVTFTNNTVTVPSGYQLYVALSFAAWMVASAGETRCSVGLSGATVNDPGQDQVTGQSTWAQTLYISFGITGGSATMQQTALRYLLLNSGITTFTMLAYQTGDNTHSVNFPTMEIMPLRWA